MRHRLITAIGPLVLVLTGASAGDSVVQMQLTILERNAVLTCKARVEELKRKTCAAGNSASRQSHLAKLKEELSRCRADVETELQAIGTDTAPETQTIRSRIAEQFEAMAIMQTAAGKCLAATPPATLHTESAGNDALLDGLPQAPGGQSDAAAGQIEALAGIRRKKTAGGHPGHKGEASTGQPLNDYGLGTLDPAPVSQEKPTTSADPTAAQDAANPAVPPLPNAVPPDRISDEFLEPPSSSGLKGN